MNEQSGTCLAGVAVAGGERQGKWSSRVGGALLTVLLISLTGCASPSYTAPEDFTAALERYRALDCEPLATINRNFTAALEKANDAALQLFWQRHLTAINQARMEKSCPGTRPLLGVRLESVSPVQAKALGLDSTSGAMIAEVIKALPAQRAGLVAGDVILGINGQKLATPDQTVAAIRELVPDSKAEILIFRNGRREIVVADFAAVSAKAVTAASLMDAAAADFDAGRYTDAARKYLDVLKQSPNDTLAWYFYGQTMEKLSDVVGAQDAYRKVISIEPKGPVADYARQALARLSPKPSSKKAARKK